jgi:hypothetical protein
MSTASGREGPRGVPAQDTSARRRGREPAISRVFLGGLAGTAAIALMKDFVGPFITGQRIDLARMLTGTFGDPHVVGGMVFHVFNGVVLFPLGFAFLSVRLPGPGLVKGLVWGAILWAMAEELIMPMLGSGFFGDTGGGWRAALSSLAGYLVYGALQGLIAAPREE